MLKLIALDVDGTLLNESGQISEQTLEMVATLRGRGVEFTLCTGRNLPMVLPFAEKLQIKLPIATCNGAEVRCLDGRVLARRSLPSDTAASVHHVLRSCDALYHVYADDYIYFENKDRHSKKMYAYYRDLQRNKDMKTILHEIDQPYMIETSNLDDLWKDESVTVEKFFVMEQRADRLQEIRRKLIKKCDLEIATSHFAALEVCHVLANKGNALLKIMEICGFLPREVASIGDGMNDVPMFTVTGNSIAMGNAINEVKMRARFVSGKNSEEGMAQALRHLLNYC
ncbi:MAG TPA: Cof-type HAD-IIB family hydrolase [Bacilli bacterium]